MLRFGTGKLVGESVVIPGYGGMDEDMGNAIPPCPIVAIMEELW